MSNNGFEVSAEDLQPRQGREIPNGEYRATVEEASAEPKENGVSIKIRYGQLSLPNGDTEFETREGATFRIGNRKVFQRSWWQHNNAMAQAIGRRELAQLAIATGLAMQPAKGEKLQLSMEPEDFAGELVGKTLVIRTKQKPREQRVQDPATGQWGKKTVLDDDGNTKMDVDVVAWKEAKN